MTVNEVCVRKVLHTQICIYSIIRINIQQVLNSTSLGILGTFRDFIYFKPITLTLLSKEHHGIVHGCRIYVFNEVCIAGICTLGAYSTTVLSTELTQRSTFNIAHMRNGNNHFVICIEIFRIEFFG